MRFEACGRSIVFAAVVEQGPYIALVVDLDRLLCALEYDTIDGREDEQLADNSRHDMNNTICARRATVIYEQNIVADIGPVLDKKLTSLDAPRLSWSSPLHPHRA
jgi:hypothetical protein